MVWRLPDCPPSKTAAYNECNVSPRTHPICSACRAGLQPTDIDRFRASRSRSKWEKQDAGIWQRRFWEHHIRDDADYATHVQYCWANPVKHGLVRRAGDWPYSSFHREVRLGRADPEFVGTTVDGRFGEVA